MGWQVAWNKHLHNRLATIHGLDFGIHAEMTGLQHLCITARYEACGNEKNHEREA